MRETPPLAWGRHNARNSSSIAIRNTPTRVGKTFSSTFIVFYLWKHPHSRGEDVSKELSKHFRVETPPLAWGRR